MSEKSTPVESAEIEEKIFILTAQVPVNGFMRPDGLSYACGSTNHDDCAAYALKKDLPEVAATEDDVSFTTARVELQRRGYLQLSHGKAGYSITPLTEKQLKKLDEAGIKIPVTFSELRLLEYFDGMHDAIEQHKFSNHTLELITHFIDHQLSFREDNSITDSRELFEALTTDFIDGGEFRDAYQNTETIIDYKLHPDGLFAVVMHYHKHDGYSGLVSTTVVKVIPAPEAPEYYRLFVDPWQEEDKWLPDKYVASQDNPSVSSQAESNTNTEPKIKVSRVKGLSSRNKDSRIDALLE
jgi:hypothetical protein